MEHIATFFTHFGAIRFGRSLEAKGLTYNMMPVPRKLSSSCGTCVRFNAEVSSDMKEDEEIEGIYLVVGEDYETLLTRE